MTALHTNTPQAHTPNPHLIAQAPAGLTPDQVADLFHYAACKAIAFELEAITTGTYDFAELRARAEYFAACADDTAEHWDPAATSPATGEPDSAHVAAAPTPTRTLDVSGVDEEGDAPHHSDDGVARTSRPRHAMPEDLEVRLAAQLVFEGLTRDLTRAAAVNDVPVWPTIDPEPAPEPDVFFEFTPPSLPPARELHDTQLIPVIPTDRPEVPE